MLLRRLLRFICASRARSNKGPYVTMNKDFTDICIYKSIEDVQFKKFIYNKLLPYADDLEAESQALLAEIKANLGRAVMINETWPGCYIWVTKLCQ